SLRSANSSLKLANARHEQVTSGNVVRHVSLRLRLAKASVAAILVDVCKCD
ncbi:hypothetical protein L195_g062876, partial [Trifolium pratense]